MNYQQSLTSSSPGSNPLTESWVAGTLSDKPHPLRVIVTPEPNCNLACGHCYLAHTKVNAGPDNTNWSECIEYALRHDIPVICAGRIITPRVIRFCEEYLKTTEARGAKPQLSFVDNGYTIFNAEQLFPKTEGIIISIDGNDSGHDKQRNRPGASRIAWGSVYKLKESGYDPILSSCLSPMTMQGWDEFEREVQDADIRMSSTLTFQTGFTRSHALFQDYATRIKALEMLVTGVPKSVQLYDSRDMKALFEIAGALTWHEDDRIPGLRTILNNGVDIFYRPSSLLWNVEYICNHDGRVISVTRETNLSFDAFLEKERQLWGFA